MNKYLKGIQALRGIFILVIIISHSSEFANMGSEGVWGASGVTGFFVISGFLSGLSGSCSEKNYKRACINSLVKKISKFYPLYLICLIVSIFIRPDTFANFLKCILLIQSYWGSTEIATAFNGNAWFLSSIMLSWLLSPIINFIFYGKSCKKSLILSGVFFTIQFIISTIFINNFEKGYYWVYIFPVSRVLDYIQGTLLANIFNSNLFKKINDTSIAEYFTGVCWLALLIIQKILPTIYQYNVIWIPITMMMVLLFAINKGQLSSYLVKSPLYKLGGISFELFMCHRMILLVVAKFGTGLLHWLIALLLAVLVSCFFHEMRRRIYHNECKK